MMDSLQDHKFNIRLVKTVKKYPVIYNRNLKEYTRAENRERAWIDIGEELNCDPQSLQRKWQNFRTILVRKLKQKQLGEHTSKYYLYDHIKFVIPYLKKSYKPELLKKTIKADRTITKSEEEEETEEEIYMDSGQSADESEIAEELYEIDEDPINFASDPEDTGSSKKRKLSTGSGEEFIIGEADVEVSQPNYEENARSNTVKNKSTKPTPTNVALSFTEKAGSIELVNNAKKQFLLSLLPDLIDMSRPQMRHFKFRVLQLLDEMLSEN